MRKGCNGVTVWEKASAEVETNQGKAMADAAVAVGAELIIWSSLPDVTAMSGGKFTSVKHVRISLLILVLPVCNKSSRDTLSSTVKPRSRATFETYRSRVHSTGQGFSCR